MGLIILGSCGTPAPPQPSPPLAPVAPTAPPNLADAKLHAGPKNTMWPSRVCLDHDALVLESSCGCNDALLCDLRVTAARILDVRLRTDPTRMKTCDDCFPMVPARCPLTQLPRGTWSLTINGAPALDFTTGADHCWTER